jgi:uncharacterized membrane protein
MRTKGKRCRKKLAVTAVIAGAVAPSVLRWVRRTGAARRAVDMRVSVVVERPVAEVFEFCRDFENFPQITDLLLSVEDSQDGRSHWSVRSPTGQVISWDAVITKYVPNSVIAWESVPGSAVVASGLMRFAPLSASDTRIDVKVTYRPVRTDLFEAIHALVMPSVSERIRRELPEARQQLANKLIRENAVSQSESDRPFDVQRADAPPSPAAEPGERRSPAPREDETRAGPENAP